MSEEPNSGNRELELLLFRLGGTQKFGINVFKVQEVIPCPALTQIPAAHPHVCGIADLRGRTTSIIDLGQAIKTGSIRDRSPLFVIITEFSREMHGLMVTSVERIVSMRWSDVQPPPIGMGTRSYMTAVTEIDGELVEIIDVEKVLDEIVRVKTQVSGAIIDDSANIEFGKHQVMVVDDSLVARNQIQHALEQIGISCVMKNDGRAALDSLKSMVSSGAPLEDQFLMIISDIEMPEMDGYSLTKAIRSDPDLKRLHVLLHSSLSGSFNNQNVKQSGADHFIPKFNPDDLARAAIDYIREQKG